MSIAKRNKLWSRCAPLVGLLLATIAGAQQTASFEPTRDVTIIQGNSDGGGTGIYISTGVDPNGNRQRALLAFESLADEIPDDMLVQQVELTVFVNQTRVSEIPVRLHRLTSDWSETAARWSRALMMTNWSEPGGDYDATVSTELGLDGTDRFYTFPSSADLVADVEFWRQNPDQNFGWIMIAEESQGESAKRMASREMGSAVFRPELTVTYGPAVEDDQFAINYGLSGGWFNPETAGQGLLLEVLPTSNQVFVTWFTYESPVASKVGSSEHRWLSGLGGINGNRVEVDLRVTSGGLFDDPTPVDRTPAGTYGTLTLEFFSCADALMTYSLSQEGLQGQRDLIRLGPVPQTCADLAAQK